MFWKTYPIEVLTHINLGSEPFKSLVFDKEHIESPTCVEYAVINTFNELLLKEIRIFLINNFGKPPRTPTLDIPESELLGEKDHILYVRDIDKNLVGCIRYHYIGKFITSKNEPIYCVDCFCIHSRWRGKGVGDYLLTQLHNYVNKNKIHYSVFLKEGRQLSIVHTPHYSSSYVYRKLVQKESPSTQVLTNLEAYRLIDIFREFNNQLFVVRNLKTRNQIWKLYKNQGSKVLVCFQDTWQRFKEGGKLQKIGWITAWIETPNITDNIREEASLELADSMFGTYDYMWINKEWINNGSTSWQTDGSFHWYLYQWATSISIKKSYCLLM